MKKGNYLSYQFFERIDDECGLAFFFNKIFKHLQCMRIVSAPMVFKDDESERGYIAGHFYRSCLFEVYAHSIIPRFNDWTSNIEEYLTKYMGSWEYYARCKRIDRINEYGGEESDYNPDGSLKTDISKDELHHYSIITYLVPDDCRDIFIDTVPEDLNNIYTDIRVDGSFTIPEMFKAIGAGHIKSYRQVNGEMVENSPEDEILNKIESETKSEGDVILLFWTVAIIANIINEVRNLPKDQDNRMFFESLLIRIQNILDFEIQDEIMTVSEIYKNRKSDENENREG